MGTVVGGGGALSSDLPLAPFCKCRLHSTVRAQRGLRGKTESPSVFGGPQWCS